MSFTGLRSVVLCLGLFALPALAADKPTAPYLHATEGRAVERKPTLLQMLVAALKPKSVHAAEPAHRPRVRHVATAARKPKAPPAAVATEPPVAPPTTVGAAATPPAPLSEADPAAKGLALFNDVSLSDGGKASCATCHFSTGHTNNKTYVGLDVVADGDPNGRNTPTLWGVGERSVFGWAGQAATLEDSIRGIIVNRMKGPEPSKEKLAALVAYVRTLNYPANWQVKDDGTPRDDASAAVKRGYELYVGDGGCGTCHVLPSFDKRSRDDIGTGGKFKVPTLHAVASTAPYFHDGRTASLRDAVKLMWEVYAKKMDSRLPTDAELDDLTAYVGAL
ncbi:cytochrome c peroxidase [Bradyrhizobium sp. SZCCHNR1053]|uniref:cytochrome c peroxidase n=1 Tax=unclassified Bradyrhizobium TaxID=2631580 RepID=UPI0039655C8D